MAAIKPGELTSDLAQKARTRWTGKIELNIKDGCVLDVKHKPARARRRRARV